MRIEMQRNDLARLMAQTTKAVESRNTMPILGTVRLVAADRQLTATATDLDIEITASAPVSGDSLALCVNAKLLAGIVSKINGDTLTMEHDGRRVTIKSGRSRFTLDTLPVDDFPSFSAGEFDVEFDVDLAALVAPVQFAISTEETRYYLNGVYLHATEAGTVAVATDGHRLSRHTGPFLASFDGVILPRKLVSILPKGNVRVSLSSTKVRIATQDTTITSKLIDGTFPDYQRVIPTGNDKIVTFAADEMVAAANRVQVVSNERERGVRLAISHDEISISLRGDSEAEDAVPATYTGDPVEVGVNAAYLAELLGAFPSGDVHMALADSMSPILFKPAADDSLLAVLMPRRV